MRSRSVVRGAYLLLLVPALGRSQSLPSVPIYSYSVPTPTASSGYAPNGNLLSYTDSVNGSWSMQYDSLNRLSTASGTAGAYQSLVLAWHYDSFGNRLNQTVSGNPPTVGVQSGWASYNGSNQAISNNLAPSITYDSAGNNTYDGNNSYKYDAEGRVCAALNGLTAVVTQYFYDAEGQRVAKATGSSFVCSMAVPASSTPSATYVLGPSGEQMTEFDGTGAWKHTNIFANGQLLATYDTAGVHFPLSDALGTVRVQASGLGVAEESFSSLPFGDGMVTNTLNGSVQDATEHHFTAKERDTESGLDYFGARYNSSSMGRFMSPDPLGGQLANPQSLNKYSYVLNNPLTNTDPTGLYTCQDSTKCDSKADQAFEKARQSDLKSKDGSVVRGASAYGDPTKDNGVHVTIGDPGKGRDGITSHDLGQDANGNLRAEENVTIRAGISGSELDATVGHEGSHVADAQDFVSTITASGNFDLSKNLSQYQTEFKAYMVTNSILNSEGDKASFGQGCDGGSCVLGFGVGQRQAGNTINQLLANPNGYGVTAKAPGALLYPTLTVPTVPK